jgi:hypothetical protein
MSAPATVELHYTDRAAINRSNSARASRRRVYRSNPWLGARTIQWRGLGHPARLSEAPENADSLRGLATWYSGESGSGGKDSAVAGVESGAEEQDGSDATDHLREVCGLLGPQGAVEKGRGGFQ